MLKQRFLILTRIFIKINKPIFIIISKVLLIVGLLGTGVWWLENQPSRIYSGAGKPAVTVQKLFQFSDPSSRFTFPEVLQLPIKEWQEVSVVNFGYKGGTGWAYVQVQSNNTQTIFLEMQTHFIDSVKVWMLDEAGSILELESTGFSKLSDIKYNPLMHRYFLVDLPMKKNQTYEVIIRGSTTPGFPMKYPIKFWEQPRFTNYSNASVWGWAIFCGILLTVAFVSLSCHIIHQKLIYFYFAAYIICFGLYSLVNDGWGIFLYSSLYETINPIKIGHILNLGICFFLLFSRKFLIIPSQSPKWWLRISPWWFYLLITFCILITNYGYSNSKIIFTVTGYWLGIAGVISILILWLAYLADALQRRFQPAWLLLASQFVLILFFSTNIILVNINTVVLPFPDMLIFRIALTIQLLFIAVGWIYRQKVITESQEQLRTLNLAHEKAVWEVEHRWQELQIKTLSMENELHGQRDRLARDLHDGIGSQLTHIISRLDLLSFSVTPQQTQLLRLRDFTRDTNQNLRETIWVLNQKEVSFKEFAMRLHGFLQNLWDEQEYPLLTWNCPALTDNPILPPMVAMHLFRITQEAIANAIKHARATNVNVHLDYKFSEIFLTIEDNGNGFNPEIASSGFGIIFMQKRAEEMAGSMFLKSGNCGTVIRASIPLTA